VLTVASLLTDAHDVHIVDGDLVRDPLPTLRRLIQEAPGQVLLGVTVMPGPQLARAIPHTRALKQAFQTLPVVWGGWFPSLHPQTCLQAAYVDFVVRGRGDATMPRLVTAIEEGQRGDHQLRTIPGLGWRAANGTIQQTPEAPPRHPNESPPLPFHLAPPERYHQRTWLGSRTNGYHSSFGCPLQCGFCAVAALNRGRWMGQSVPRIMADLEVILEAGANAIEMFDNNFFVSETRARAFAAAITPHHIQWWGEGTIDGLMGYSKDTLRVMRASGLRMIFFGAESGSDSVLELMNKGGLRSSTTLALARRMLEVDIVPEFSFVLGNPQSTHDDIQASFQLIRRLKAIHPACEIILYLYAPEPFQQAELWKAAQQRGFRFPDRLEAWEANPRRLFNLRREVETPWLRPRDVQRVRDFETVLNAWSPGVSDVALGPRARQMLKLLAGPRYQLGLYRRPLGLRIALKALRHRRVEQEGL